MYPERAIMVIKASASAKSTNLEGNRSLLWSWSVARVSNKYSKSGAWPLAILVQPYLAPFASIVATGPIWPTTASRVPDIRHSGQFPMESTISRNHFRNLSWISKHSFYRRWSQGQIISPSQWPLRPILSPTSIIFQTATAEWHVMENLCK